MRNYFLLIAITLMLCVSCSTTSQRSKNAKASFIANLDTTANPGIDFYKYACDGWAKANPLPDAYSRYGAFDKLDETSTLQVKEIITRLAQADQVPGTDSYKIATLYKIAMDSVKLNEDGYAPIKSDLEMIANITSSDQIISVIQTLPIMSYFNYYVSADEKQSDENILQLVQGGLTLGYKDYYTDTDESSQELLENYKQHIVNMFELVGFSNEDANKKMQSVFNIENLIAKASKDGTELRDPEANYNKMTTSELRREISGIQWDKFFTGLNIQEIDNVLVGQVEALKEAARIINEESLEDNIAYLEWRLINTAAPFLSDEFVDENFAFFGTILSGSLENYPRWDRSISTINSALGEAVGKLYVEEYFPAESKERMTKLVANLQVALGETFDEAKWMDNDTKVAAHEKLDAFIVKIGYPDQWMDYSDLTISYDSYWDNYKRAAAFEQQDNISNLGKPVDKNEWLMNPQTVNAYYNPTSNEICFPAAILQYPFFDAQADDAFNYGAIGVVIGHEMTHGFDDQGRQADKDGNLRGWWNDKDIAEFNKRAQVMVDFFDNIEVLPGLMGNGSMTLGENLADNGGLNVSYRAYKNATKDAPLGNIEGFTADQRFFFAYSCVWAANIREAEIRHRTKSDVHSLGKWRVNGALPHIDAWYEAFNIQPNDSLYIAPEERVAIWSGR